MPMIIPVGYAHVQHVFGGAALPRGAVITYGVDLTGAPGTIDDVANRLYTRLQTDLVATVVGGAIDHLGVRVKEGPNDTGPQTEIFGESHGSSTACAPPNVSFLVQKRTPLGGKMGRGRFYLPGVTEGFVGNDGTLTGGSLTALQDGASNFWAHLIDDDNPMVVLHSEEGVTPSEVTSLVAVGKVATQRHRLR